MVLKKMPKHYFTYKTLDDLRRDAAAWKIHLPLLEDRAEIQRTLARPVEIRGEHPWRIGNSLAVHPMEGCDGEPDGRPGELTFRRYRRFGAGGAKLIWFEACAVTEDGRANPRQLWIHAGSAPALEKLLGECRALHAREFGSSEDLVAVLQLTHSGRYSYAKPRVAYHHPVLDSFPFANLASLPARAKPFEVANDIDLAALEECFVEAAALAQKIGFDGIDLKMTHGYLLAELLSARARPGPYGGSLENRARFALNVLGKIRRRCGEGFLLAVRLGIFDGVPYAVSPVDSSGTPRPFPVPYSWGFGVNAARPLEPDLAEPLEFIAWLQQAGVRLLNVSMGNPYVNPHLGRPYEKPNEGLYETPEHPLLGVARHFSATAQIQQAFPGLAVVGSGYSWLQHFMVHAGAANIKLGRVTLMGVGRGALAYPQFARDALTRGELDPLKTCKTLSFCTYLMRQKNHPRGQFPTGCPPFDKEGYGAIVKEARAAGRSQKTGARRQNGE